VINKPLAETHTYNGKSVFEAGKEKVANRYHDILQRLEEQREINVHVRTQKESCISREMKVKLS
jgi:hypothetical protein